MIYRAIGLMSGSSLDGLDIVFAEFRQEAGRWNYVIREADCYTYTAEWLERLKRATSLPAFEYQLLHTDYGHYLGREVNRFIEEHQLQYQVALVCSHGHTTFHRPDRMMTAQLGDGAAIAAETGLPVVTDLRALDVAFGGQGAPIVPIGEKYLMGDNRFFMNIGGIANISAHSRDDNGRARVHAFDICPANRVLNLLANQLGQPFDPGGSLAAEGRINTALLDRLNSLDYYRKHFPKSLPNEFGTETVYQLINDAAVNTRDALHTYTEHIALQTKNAILSLGESSKSPSKLLVTGGGAFNTFLISKLGEHLRDLNLEVVVPEENLVNYKEALIMAFIGVLRWRQEYNVLATVTGAVRDSIGGALWNGQE